MRHVEFRKHVCDLCGSDVPHEIKVARNYMTGPLHVCTNCGLVYVQYRRSAKDIAENWNEMFGDVYTAEWPGVAARHAYVARFISQTVGKAGDWLCEIGAGEGRFLQHSRNIYGFKGFGVEPSKENCIRMKVSGLDTFCGTIEEYAAHAEVKFDIVCVLWTLENVGDPMGLLKAANSLVADDGHIVVATGSRNLVPFKKPLSKYLSKTPPDTHPTRWSYNTLRSALYRAGFAEVHTNEYTDSDYLVAVGGKSKDPVLTSVMGGIFLGDKFTEVDAHFEQWYNLFP